ncbi:hypothetical protein GQ44DRAFT_202306 [Phaeosphaeriaceae sp. PMI808]|nr:hypothetical protein GQ44DRAFT_202306 [Phaeosphaeriaceae sp. PMI808]
MGRIYSDAKTVLVWLGPEQDGSDEVLGILHHMGTYLRYDSYTQTVRSPDQCPESEKHWADLSVPLPYYNGELDAVLALLMRPYFTRVWIRQEVGLASHAIIHCGPQMLEWETFRSCVAWLSYKPYYASAVSAGKLRHIQDHIRLVDRLCKWKPGIIRYASLRFYLADAQCTDPRDKIFATLALLRSDEQQLGILPDYSQGTEQVYTEVARRALIRHKSLNILETCAMSCRILDIPSWTPDWSVPMQHFGTLQSPWSACGWISSMISTQDGNSLYTTGVKIAQVQATIQCRTDDIHDEDKTRRDAIVLKILRKLQPTHDQLLDHSMTLYQWAERFCSTSLKGFYADDFHPPHMRSKKIEEHTRALETIWSSTKTFECSEELDALKYISFEWWPWIQGLWFFKCTNGYSGATASAGVQEGDLIAVLLGCRYPVILRETTHLGLKKLGAWDVVSTASVAGLMMGEAIYGENFPSYWTSVYHDRMTSIDGYINGLYDPKTKTLKTNPAEILTEMGIKVESYQRKPHLLEVLPETLRAAGIQLEEFILA